MSEPTKKLPDSEAKKEPVVTSPSLQENMELLSQLSQALWREPSYERLLQKFIEIAHERFGVGRAGLFTLKQNQGATELSPQELEFRQVSRWEESFPTTFAHALSAINLKTPEHRQGLNHIHCAGNDCFFLLLGDPAADWQILVWDNRVEDQTVLHSVIQVQCDFISRQLQSASIWFRRLDKTQALLYRDDLTGVFNSRYLDLAIDSEMRRSQRFQTSFSLLFIDLDNFKLVNDKFGHLAGSSVLRQLADVLREAAREVDSVIRYGGDEFVILLLGATSVTGVLAAERMRRKIENTRFLVEQGVHISLTASIGVAAFPEHSKDRDALLKLADEMMYQSKRQGKNRVTLAKAKDQGDDKAEISESKS